MRTLKDVLKRNAVIIVLWAVFLVTGFAVFSLYNVMLEPLFYAGAVTLFIMAVYLAAEFGREHKRAKERAYALASITADRFNLPEPRFAEEEDYQEMIDILGKRIDELVTEFSGERQDYLDYYTDWVHQIKTPIAVMKLKLAEDTPENREMSAELFRIEQYVDMALQYSRLGSSSNDLVIREYSLDELIRESVRKFAPQFVGKKLKLDYAGTDETLVTDRKWYAVILDQLLSNAIKYTQAGTITITVSDGCVTVADTGIGIAAEDLPRIFEKGYTGNNGRIGEKSTGLGLYLAKKAADLLALELSVESDGEGTKVKIWGKPGVAGFH